MGYWVPFILHSSNMQLSLVRTLPYTFFSWRPFPSGVTVHKGQNAFPDPVPLDTVRLPNCVFWAQRSPPTRSTLSLVCVPHCFGQLFAPCSMLVPSTQQATNKLLAARVNSEWCGRGLPEGSSISEAWKVPGTLTTK